MTPYNCFVTLRSKKFEEEKDLLTEVYYDAKYKLEPIPRQDLDDWAKAIPKPGESISLCPENIFVPKKPLILKKAPKPNGGDEPGFPELIKGDKENESQVWYKQDDSFN